ncbi:MAG: ribose 5-phosphate isomerase B [Pirellulaceae bacterium]
MNTIKPLVYAIGGDHAGYPLKAVVAQTLLDQKVELIDCGACDETSSDYPDFALAVGQAIRDGRADRGILICGSGVGVSVAANKIPGVRAALCHDCYSARQGVEHDDMNVLCIGARIIGPELAMECIRAFMNATYTPLERHARRLAKVLEIERQFSRDA